LRLVSRNVRWFVVVGFLNTCIYYLSYLLLHGVGVEYLAAHLVATGFAMVCSYFLNCLLTFRVPPSWRTFALFPLSNATNVLVTTIGLRVVVAHTQIDERIAPLLVAVTAIPITYLVTRVLMLGGWRDPTSPASGDQPRLRASQTSSLGQS
jgi:putative flippase GtrA